MKRCIFCGKSENEFDPKNRWSIEHIIPEALGNRGLKLDCVCKRCNSGLGRYVDNHVVNSALFKLIRQHLGLRSRNGVIPNAFSEGEDQYGNKVRMDLDLNPRVVPRVTTEAVDEKTTKIHVVAATKEEAENCLRKTLARKHLKPEEQERLLAQAPNSTEEVSYVPQIRYEREMDWNRFYMEALKIGYEYAVCVLGERYLEDETAREIRGVLHDAICGKFEQECPRPKQVGLFPKESQEKMAKLQFSSPVHLIGMAHTIDNGLIVLISLFGDWPFSYIVSVSKNADRYPEERSNRINVVPIAAGKTEQ